MANNDKNGGGKAAPKTLPDGTPRTAADPAEIQAKIDADAETRRRIEIEQHEAFIEKIRREREEAEKLRPLPPITQAVSGRVARPDDEVVQMVFPRPMFTWAEPTPDHENPIYRKRFKVAFGSGIQDVPSSLVDNEYLRLAGVKPVAQVAKENSES